MEEKNEKVVYEVGYHIIPTFEEAEIPAHASNIKAAIEKTGGTVIAEELPKLISLAYEISKNINSKKLDFNKAYFGWIKFELESGEIAAVKAKMESMVEVLRFIIVKTVKENTLHVPKIPMFKKENKEVANSLREEKVEGEAEKPKASAEEIDKSIDELVIN